MEYLLFALIFIIGAVITVIVIDINRFTVKEYIIYSEKVDSELDIALLADLHDKEYGRENYKLIEAIREMDPDLICVAGDMLTAKPGSRLPGRIDKAVRFFDYLKDHPIYYGIGNHEYRLKIYPDQYRDTYDIYKDELVKMGITVLENEYAYIPGTKVRIQGLMIDRSYYKRFTRNEMTAEYIHGLTGDWDKDDYCIMLAHNPEYFEAYAASGADMVLSGHVHGGIMRLPILGGVISPKLTLFPRYDGGIFECGSSQMILSRGLGYHTLPLRIFNPGELIHIRLLPCK